MLNIALIVSTVVICLLFVVYTRIKVTQTRISDLESIREKSCCFGKQTQGCPAGGAGIGTKRCCSSKSITGPVCGSASGTFGGLSTCDQCKQNTDKEQT